MRRKEIDMHRPQELVLLYRRGVGARERARLLKGPNQERKYREALRVAGLLDGPVDAVPELAELRAAAQGQLGEPLPPKQEESSVEPFRSDIERMLKREAGPKAMYDWLRLHRAGFEGSLSAVKRMCLRIRKEWGPRCCHPRRHWSRDRAGRLWLRWVPGRRGDRCDAQGRRLGDAAVLQPTHVRRLRFRSVRGDMGWPAPIWYGDRT